MYLSKDCIIILLKLVKNSYFNNSYFKGNLSYFNLSKQDFNKMTKDLPKSWLLNPNAKKNFYKRHD